MSNSRDGEKKMFVGENRRGESWTDLLPWSEGDVKTGADGWGKIPGLCYEC